MALLNNLYIFVEDESLTLDVESTSHPVEKGVEITDHVRRLPCELSIKGKIVDLTQKNKEGKDIVTKKASYILAEIKKLKDSGSLITYIGRNALSNMQIQSFSTSHPYTNWGGCDFDMTLKEVRIAKSAYTPPKKTVKTLFGERDLSKRVNVGTQQVSKGENKAVYHTVKKGDTVWTLVTKKYKTLKRDSSKTTNQHCNWVMNKNPKAFSRKGDFGTLQIGKKLLVGYRK